MNHSNSSHATLHTTTLILAGALLLSPGCKSSGTRNSADLEEETTIDHIKVPEPDSIGMALVDLDIEIAKWSSLVLTAGTPEDERMANRLEKHLMRITRQRQKELIEQLESGPLTNRVVAAAALGFTGSEAAHSPLLAALEDYEPRVVGNALLGLALLERGDTPIGRISELLSNSPDSTIRTMAAYAARSVVQTTEAPESILEAARLGVIDEAPGVRSQCVLLLAQFGDTESLRTIGDLLFDEEPLVSSAAARSLAVLGMEHPEHKGTAARQLAQAYSSLDKTSRQLMRKPLIDLSSLDYGDDPTEWLEWALRLP